MKTKQQMTQAATNESDELCGKLLTAAQSYRGAQLLLERLQSPDQSTRDESARFDGDIDHILDRALATEIDPVVACQYFVEATICHRSLVRACDGRHWLDAMFDYKRLTGPTILQLQKVVFPIGSGSEVFDEPDWDFSESARLKSGLLAKKLLPLNETGPLTQEQWNGLYAAVVNSLTTNLMAPEILDDILCWTEIPEKIAKTWLESSGINCRYDGLFWATSRYLDDHGLPVNEVINWLYQGGIGCDLDLVAKFCRGNTNFSAGHGRD